MQPENFKIEKNVPPPENRGGRKYPFNQMEVGDSFAFEEKRLEQIRSAASYFGRRNNRKYSVRFHEGGFRCWRLA